jgi:hypothetical protein
MQVNEREEVIEDKVRVTATMGGLVCWGLQACWGCADGLMITKT